MAYNKMNNSCRCAGRLSASIRLKYKNKFTIKSLFFNQSWTPPPKFFGANLIPYMTIKWSTKVYKRQLTLGTLSRENHHTSHFIQDQRPQMHYQSTSQTTKSCISNTRLRLLIAYQLTSHYRAMSKQTSHLKTTYTLSPPDPYMVEEESLYFF